MNQIIIMTLINEEVIELTKEYWLVKEIKTTGHKNPLQIVDRIPARGLREAKKDFQQRNSFKKLLIKSELIIVKSESYYQ